MPHCPECSASVADAATQCSLCGADLLTQPATVASPPKAPDLSQDPRLRQELATCLAPRYELLKPLGHGGMGAVFLAREPALKRLVAIKVLSPYFVADPTAYARFGREARAVAALSHPNVLSVYAVGETAELGLPYIVMQFVDGPPLSTWIGEHGPAGERDARRILGGVAAGLAAAHARGLVHRDVKPGNILLESDSGRVLVADFGLAAAVAGDSSSGENSALTSTGLIMGTPVYMSPEQATGQPLTAKSDVYSLGMVAYELLTGELPFTAKSAVAWAAAHLRDIPRPIGQRRPDLSPEVAQLVDRCLAKLESERPTAHELAEGVLPSLEAEIQWPPPALSHLLGRGRLLVRSVQLAAVGILVLLFALAAPPRQVSGEGAWWTGFASAPTAAGSSLGVRSEAAETSGGRTPRWWFAALTLGLGAATAGLTWLTVLSFPTVRSAWRHRLTGWSWGTIADVLADPDGRSGLLLTGSREMAALPPEQRDRIRRTRRWMMCAALLGGLWVIAVGGAAALLVVLGPLDGDRLNARATLGLWLALLLSFAAALGATLVAVIGEARSFGPLPRRRTHTGTFASGRLVESGHVAADWYHALPGGQLPGPSRMPFGLVDAGYLMVALLGLASLLALVALSAATLVSASRSLALGPETAEAAALLQLRAEGASWRQAREAWSPYLPQPLDISDSEARALVRRQMDVSDTAGSLPSYPVDPAEIARSLARDTLAQGVAPAFQTGSRPVGSDTARLLDLLGRHPRTALFRRMARAPPVDIFGSTLGGPVGSYGSFDSLAQPQYGPLRTAAHANLLGALLATWSGDPDTAVQRLAENAAMAEHFLRAPSVFANRYGVGMLQQLALLPLAEVELARGNRDRAQSLVAAGDQIREEVLGHAWPGRLAGLAADPHDLSRYARALRSELLSPGYRVESFYGGWGGFCLNRWEILRGLSPLRETAVLTAGDAMTDVPHAGELARLMARTWEGESSAHLTGLIGRLRWCWSSENSR
jgi:hypothetical protein